MTMSVAAVQSGRSDFTIARNYFTSLILNGLRSPAYLAFTIGMPLVYYLIFDQMHSQAKVDGVTFAAVNMVNMAAFGAINAALSGGTRIEMELASGWFRQLRLTPLSAVAFTVTRALAALTFVVPAILVLYGVGGGSGQFTASPGRWAASALAIVLGSVPFVLLGLAIGLLVKHEATMPAAVAAMTLMALFGGLWFPISMLPSAIAAIAPFLPSYWMALYARWFLLGSHVSWSGIAVLVTWIVVCGAVCTAVLSRTLTTRR